jgi:hypothetical protein
MMQADTMLGRHAVKSRAVKSRAEQSREEHAVKIRQ